MSDRDDAALVYRFLRDHGPADAVEIQLACFPSLDAGPPSTRAALAKRSLSRVFASIGFIRSQGVVVRCQTAVEELSKFSLESVT